MEALQKIAVAEEVLRGTALSVLRLVDALLGEAFEQAVSDIHIEPNHDGLRIRFRIDGLLKDVYLFPPHIHAELIARLKILSGLRTDEHFTAQDGRFRFLIKDAWADVRISIAPTYHGENAVLRLLTRALEEPTLEALGIPAQKAAQIEHMLGRASGMILVTGPTGSGKTTSLYTLMRILKQRPASLVSIEDPVEYAIPGVTQIQANQRTGLTFSQGLRSVLRQDPDILMVGEIRDSETAGLATNAALTGHLILSTLHTNDALSAIPRLSDLGVEPYLIAATVRLVIAQRLLRKLCASCKVSFPVSNVQKEELCSQFGGIVSIPDRLYQAKGCASCNGSGYSGRIGIFEILTIDEALQEAIAARTPLAQMRKRLRSLEIDSLEEAGVRAAAEGMTTIEELLRVRYA